MRSVWYGVAVVGCGVMWCDVMRSVWYGVAVV